MPKIGTAVSSKSKKRSFAPASSVARGKVAKSPKVSAPRVSSSGGSAVIGPSFGGSSGTSGHTFQFNRSRGQHILTNPLIVDSIIDKAGIKVTDTILEIGPGSGNLTAKMISKAKAVIAVEIDERMVAELNKRFLTSPHRRRLTIAAGDALALPRLPRFDLCVANLPYQISSPFIFRLLRESVTNPFRAAIVLVQREFALRLVARPGEPSYCRLSVNTQFLCRPKHLMKVGRNNFKPPPKVESSVVQIIPRTPLPAVAFEEWDGLVRICFQRKNRTLSSLFRQANVLRLLGRNRATLAGQQGSMDADDDEEVQLDEERTRVLAVLEAADALDSRARTMAINDFLSLLVKFSEAGYRFSGKQVEAMGVEEEE